MKRMAIFRPIWRASLRLIFFGAIIGFALLPHPGDAPVQAIQHLNIVVIMLDDLDVESLDLMVEAGFMPNFQEHILDRGISFSETFVTNALCCPSRATYLTGQYAHNHKVLGNTLPKGSYGDGGDGILWWDLFGDDELDGDFEGENETIAVWMQNAGYNTGYVGKYLNGYGKETAIDYVPPGWSDWQGLLDPGTYCMYNYSIYDSQDDTISVYTGDGRIKRVRDGELIEVVPVDSWTDNYQTDVLAQRSIEFISDSAQVGAPFFLTIMPLAPHVELCGNIPFEWASGGISFADMWKLTIRPANRHSDTSILPSLEDVMAASFNEEDYDDKPRWMSDEASPKYRPLMTEEDIDALRKQYKDRLASLRAVDDLIGNVVAELASVGELDNTVIVFTSDNGMLSGEHRLTQKKFAYEESIRVPLVIAAPWSSLPQTRNEMVLNNDLAPTIADLADASIPVSFDVDGRSLVPLLNAQPQADWQRKRFLVEHWETKKSNLGMPTYYGIRYKRFLYVHWLDEFKSREFYPGLDTPSGAEQLYNFYPHLPEDIKIYLNRQVAQLAGCIGNACRSLEDGGSP